MKILVHLHVYYGEQAVAYISRLRKLGLVNARLFVTISKTAENLERTEKIVKAAFPNAKIMIVENVGYDIWPFLAVLKRVNLQSYDYVVKLHTKSRKCGFGRFTRFGARVVSAAIWSDYLSDALIGGKRRFRDNIRLFQTGKKIGMVGSRFCLKKMDKYDAWAVPSLKGLMRRLGLPEIGTCRFVAGTMFMAKASLMSPLLKLREKDFVFTDAYVRDCTFSHLVERGFGAVVEAQGFKIAGVHNRQYLFRTVAYGVFCSLVYVARKTRKLLLPVGETMGILTRGSTRRLLYVLSGRDGQWLRNPLNRFRVILWGINQAFADSVVRRAIAVEMSSLFDEKFYCKENPGCAEKTRHPVIHYLENGYKPSCVPSPLFSPTRYLGNNPDVAGHNLLVHWLVSGRFENRNSGQEKSRGKVLS